MTDFSSVTLPAPKDWQAFERHSRLLFAHSLGDPQTQNNGRSGQRQHGVDIFGHRDGAGHLVGIQCKGKEADYGGSINEAELRREVKKTEKFQPAIAEFILATTAPDDAVIQEVARKLEEELRGQGRNLKIVVWGWGRIHQEIVRFPEAIKAFHPDGTPFTDLLLDQNRQVKELVRQQGDEHQQQLTRILSAIETRLPQTQIAALESADPDDALNKHIHDQINTYRDMITDGRPKTAIQLLKSLQEQLPQNASDKLRFRIVANIGVAHHRLGDQDVAAGLFLEAAALNPNDPVALSNKIAALTMQKRREDAHAAAIEASTRFPDNPDIALQRLQALSAGEDFSSVWQSLSAAAREGEPVAAYRIFALKQQNDPLWPSLLDEARQKYPENRQLRAIQAQSVLERVLNLDISGLGAPVKNSPSSTELAEAAQQFQSLWDFSIEKELPPDWAAAHNGALALNIMGDVEGAAALLDSALGKGSEVEETKRFRIAIHVRSNQISQARALAATLPDSPLNSIYQADLALKSAPASARLILALRDAWTDRRDIIAAAQIYIDSYLAEEKFDEAAAEAERFETLLPGDPHPSLALYRIHAARGDESAEIYLTEALRRVCPETHYIARFSIAQALGGAGRFDEAVDLLDGQVSTTHDSPALRELIAAAANADRRSVLHQTLAKLPSDVLAHPYYRKARVALAIRSDDVNAAEVAVRSFLEIQPRSLEMQLQLMQLLLRQDKDAELRTETNKPASDFDGRPEEFIYFAQFKDAHGDWREAHDLAYRIWLANQSNPTVNMRYVGLLLRPGHPTNLEISPPVSGGVNPRLDGGM